VYGNIITENEVGGGLKLEGNSGSLTLRVYNNTFWDAFIEVGNPTSTGTFAFTNNIVYEPDDVPLTDSGTDITGHNNNTYVRTGGGTTLVSSGGSTYTAGTLSTYESQSLSSDPIFVNTGNLPTAFTGAYGSTLAPNNGGLALQATSPSCDTGVNLGSTYQSTIASTVRGTDWDRGAYDTVAIPPTGGGGKTKPGQGRGRRR
jgi:hypothetical protein